MAVENLTHPSGAAPTADRLARVAESSGRAIAVELLEHLFDEVRAPGWKCSLAARDREPGEAQLNVLLEYLDTARDYGGREAEVGFCQILSAHLGLNAAGCGAGAEDLAPFVARGPEPARAEVQSNVRWLRAGRDTPSA